MSNESARDIIVAGRGQHFDPDIVDSFLHNFPAFCEISARHRDVPPETEP
jgi:putative two-component system response regulator